MNVDNFLGHLVSHYRRSLSQVDAIFGAMSDAGMVTDESELDNDHIAIRAFASPGLGIETAAEVFLDLGYERRDQYQFEAKKLDAYWFSPPRDDLPRVFISEIRVGELSDEAQSTLMPYLSEAAVDQSSPLERFTTLPWPKPNSSDFERLANESEYASWTLCHGYAINHLTIAVHDLPPPYNDIERFSRFIADCGIELNQAGGEIKISADGLLKQSSTKAPLADYAFADGRSRAVAGAYVEFAERLPLNPAKSALSRADRRDGFEAANADKIFESTFSKP